MHDRIVEQVIIKYRKRSDVGIKKYGTTLDGNNTDNFLVHLQEELMDASLYVEKLLTFNKQVTELVNSTVNDWELGQKVRNLIK
jgi:hypothetical protein